MSEIQRLESALMSLDSSRNYYIGIRDTAKVKRDEAKVRRDRVNSLINDLKWDFDGNARGINTTVNLIDNDMNKGLKGNRVAANILSTVQADQEKEPESDADLKEAIAKLTEEYNDLNGYYEQKKSEISYAQGQINTISWQMQQTSWALNQAYAAAWSSSDS